MTIQKEPFGVARHAWRLSFPADLEARFEADTGDERCRRVIRHNYVGIVIYDAFLLGDWLLIRDIFLTSLCLHLLVMTPIMVLVIVAIARRPAAWLRESILAGGIVLGTTAILGLMLLSRSPLRSSEHMSVVLVILFATMVQRIRFPYVAIACLVCLVLYVAALSTFVQHEPARAAVAVAVFAGVVLFSLIGSYNLEREQRMSYFLALRDRLRNEELEVISRRDALTGAGNRRALDLELARRRAADGSEGQAATAVLIFDIDLFKVYNDRNGHPAGDVCLKRVASIISDDIRVRSDHVFRLGGEEFLVLLDDCTAPEAQAIGERIRSGVETAAIARGAIGKDVVTVSVGAASRVVDNGACLEDIIANADRALYAAKNAGRNQVRRFEGSWPIGGDCAA